MKPEKKPETPKDVLRQHVRFFYDIQKLRIAHSNRCNPAVESVQLSDEQKARFESDGDMLLKLERSCLRAVEDLCESIDSSVNEWLRSIRGIGPTMAGVIISEIDPALSRHVSNLWSFAGLGVNDGHAPRPTKGEKRPYNSFLRAKLVFVLGGSFLKANNETYRPMYDGYKTRKQNTLGPCFCCSETGKAKSPENGKMVDCWNCDGGKLAGKAPWGKSDAHRHQAAIRFMVKMFLRDLWVEWRGQKGLPVTDPYSEAKLGMVAHGVAS